MSACRRDVVLFDSDSMRLMKGKAATEVVCHPRYASSLDSLKKELFSRRPDVFIYVYSERDERILPEMKSVLTGIQFQNMPIMIVVDVTRQDRVAEGFPTSRLSISNATGTNEEKGSMLNALLQELDSLPQVLILDADEETRNLEIYNLSDEYNPVDIRTGKEMLEYLEEHKVDIMLVDIDIEDVDALTLLDHVKTDEKLKTIPFVMITDFPDKTTTTKFLQGGASGYMVKPVEAVTYRARIDEILKKMYELYNRKTVLIVDDDVMTLKSLQSMLKSEYKVVAMSSADQAIKFLETKVPDIMILDYEMPVKNGLFVLRSVRSRAQFNNCPVIMLTGNKDKQTVISCIQSGAQGYITKPINPMSLMLRVRQFLGTVPTK